MKAQGFAIVDHETTSQLSVAKSNYSRYVQKKYTHKPTNFGGFGMQTSTKNLSGMLLTSPRSGAPGLFTPKSGYEANKKRFFKGSFPDRDGCNTNATPETPKEDDYEIVS